MGWGSGGVRCVPSQKPELHFVKNGAVFPYSHDTSFVRVASDTR